MKSSVMILNGMGGQRFSEQHALNSARLMNAAQPEYLATLMVSEVQDNRRRIQQGFNGQYEPLSPLGLFEEIRLMLDNLELEKTIFRSDHASNYLVLKGVLDKDKGKLLQQVEQAIRQPQQAQLRPEWARGL